MDKNKTIEGQMLYGLLNNLAIYEQELAYLMERATYKNIQPDASIELDALKELITAQQAEITELTEEVLKRIKQTVPVNEHNQIVIPFTQVIKNNHLREQIRKIERSVFYLKYHVNKLLSIAS